MAGTDFVFRKRAVYTCLEPLMSNAQVMQALVLWETDHSSAPKYAMRKFVAELCRMNNNEFSQSEVLSRLVRTMTLPEDRLLPDPSPEMARFRQHNQGKATAVQQSPLAEAFLLLLGGMVQPLTIDIRRSVIAYAMEILERNRVNDMFRFELEHWLVGKSTSIKIPVSESKRLRAIVNVFYVALCEFSGPVEADSLLADAASSVRQAGLGDMLHNQLI